MWLTTTVGYGKAFINQLYLFFIYLFIIDIHPNTATSAVLVAQ